MKTIWMIEQVHRVKGTETWSEPQGLYAYSNSKAAENDIKNHKGSSDGYIEYKYLIKEYNLYDE